MQTSLATNELKVKIPKGTRDFGPEFMLIRDRVFNTIKNVFRRHGAVEIDTPIFELKKTLIDNYGENSKLIYDIADQGGEILSLRYDLTVPFARYCASNRISSIKRFHIARVYRRDQPSMNRGRFREFYQCDYDIAGQYDTCLADADVLKVVCEILTDLNIGKYKIKINHRKLLSALMNVCKIPSNKFNSICSAIDKLDKKTWEIVKEEIIKKLDAECANRLGEFVCLYSELGHPSELLERLKSNPVFNDVEDAFIAFNELERLFEFLKAMNCLQFFVFDLSLARGLDYYTGLIYEAVLIDDLNIGSIAGGGRYDELIGRFSGKQIPAVGVSIGVERIFAILMNQQCEPSTRQTQVLVASIGPNLVTARMELCSVLWKSGFNVEFLYFDNPSAKKQLQFALNQQIPLVCWIGENELRNDMVTVKNIEKKTQETVYRSDLINFLKKLLQN